MLSNIIQTLNDAYQTNFADEDRVDIEEIRRKVHEHEELQTVMIDDNTDTNKRYKFEGVIDGISLEFVTSKLELYTKLSKPKVNAYLKDQLYQDYQAQQ